MKQFTQHIPDVTHNESELRVDFGTNNARIRLYGADNYDRIRGNYFDAVVMDEYADMDPRAWSEVIRPALSDRKGMATFIGTPKGRNAFWELHTYAKSRPDWYSSVLKASETELIDAAELSDLRDSMTAEEYAQEYECSFDAAIQGAYYGSLIADAERAGRITSIDPVPGIPVQTAWDLGIGDSTSIWFWQVTQNELRVVDHYESHGKPLDHYVSVIKSKPYHYGEKPVLWVPHDARVRSLETGRTRIETLRELGCECRLVPDHRVEDGINGARVSFPRMWFDEVRTRFGLEALRQYRTDFDEKAKVFKNTPKHDWTSHAADAFRYMAMAWRQLDPPAKPKPDPITELTRPKTFAELMGDMDDWTDAA